MSNGSTLQITFPPRYAPKPVVPPGPLLVASGRVDVTPCQEGDPMIGVSGTCIKDGTSNPFSGTTVDFHLQGGNVNGTAHYRWQIVFTQFFEGDSQYTLTVTPVTAGGTS